MTLNFMRPAMAMAIALGLAGCGGKATFPVNGTVMGLQYDGLILTTNGMDVAVHPAPNPTATTTTSFTFPNTLSYGDVFNVIVKTDPPPALPHQPLHQTCVVSNGSDSAGHLAAINVAVSCTTLTYTIGGTIRGLTGTGLELINGSTGGTAMLTATGTTDTPFTIGLPVKYNDSYGVSVLTQPTNQHCDVTNAAGVMGDANVTNVVVTCGPLPPP